MDNFRIELGVQYAACGKIGITAILPRQLDTQTVTNGCILRSMMLEMVEAVIQKMVVDGHVAPPPYNPRAPLEARELE